MRGPACVQRIRTVAHADDARFVSRARPIVPSAVSIYEHNTVATSPEKVRDPRSKYSRTNDGEISRARLHRFIAYIPSGLERADNWQLMSQSTITPKASALTVWPELPLAEWEPTFRTLHMWTQIVGKVRLGLTPLQNHWWNAALYVNTR